MGGDASMGAAVPVSYSKSICPVVQGAVVATAATA
jgi:hypothetical protein